MTGTDAVDALLASAEIKLFIAIGTNYHMVQRTSMPGEPLCHNHVSISEVFVDLEHGTLPIIFIKSMVYCRLHAIGDLFLGILTTK